MSFALAELVREELLDLGDRLGLVGAVGFELDRRPQARGEHHHAHDALRVDAPALARDPDRGSEAPGCLRELGGGARVQPELVGDRDALLLHQPRCSMRTIPSAAPESALSTRSSSVAPSRWVSALISIGRFTPAMPSTCPGTSRREPMLDGVAP